MSNESVIGHRSSGSLALCDRLSELSERLEPVQYQLAGRLSKVVGMRLEAVGCRAPVGGRCQILPPKGSPVEAEVVGFEEDKVFLMPITIGAGLTPEARVVPIPYSQTAEVGAGLLGRVIDGAGKPLDGAGKLELESLIPLSGTPLNPMAKRSINEPLDVGIRSINALLTIGRGQRLGLFAGSGVGKSTLLGQMTRHTKADVVVVGLIGERSREVRDFIQQTLGAEGLKRAVVVATPADSAPLSRLHGAMRATAIAEHFREQGKNVLLLMDSLTRFAQAQREIALSVGEMPVARGYPPSVFAKLPQLVERAGNGDEGSGSITAIYTVLAEGDDQDDPIVDAARAILDGHIVLSRSLADTGHYPAIDVESSVSRLMTQITGADHQSAAREFQKLMSAYTQNQDLINVGAYSQGSDPAIDAAVAMRPQLLDFLQQDIGESVSLEDSCQSLLALQQERFSMLRSDDSHAAE